MRNLKSLFGIILGMLLTMPFLTACGDDESKIGRASCRERV